MPYQNCLHCGNRFYARPSTIHQGFGKYCSKHCSNTHNNPSTKHRIPPDIEQKIITAYEAGMSMREAGDKFGYGRGGVAKVLTRHNIEPRSVGDSLRGRKFSKEWKQKISENHADVSGSKNPMFGRPPTNPQQRGKSTFVQCIGKHVRSSWEATVANALLQAGYTFVYEKERLSLGEYTTLIDFYLPDINVWIEVKGRENEHFKKILDLFPQYHPDKKLIVFRQEEITRIQRDPLSISGLLT